MGVLICILSVIIGTTCGLVIKRYFHRGISSNILYDTFGYGSLAIGIININKAQTLTVIILSIILGTCIGNLINIEDTIIKYSLKVLNRIHNIKIDKNDLSLIIMIFCFSGSGIFGALSEGMAGNSEILIAKSIMDIFTAFIFAISLGSILYLIIIPESFILVILLIIGKLVAPILTYEMIQDFMAVGGLVTLIIGLKILKIRSTKILNLIPSLIIVFPLSWFINLLP